MLLSEILVITIPKVTNLIHFAEWTSADKKEGALNEMSSGWHHERESKQKEMTTWRVTAPRKSPSKTQPKPIVYPYGNSCSVFRIYKVSRKVKNFYFKRHAGQPDRK